MIGHRLLGMPYWLPLSIIGVLSWGTWLVRQALGSLYRPACNDHRESTSLVVPVWREDPAVLAQCLETWLANHPDEIVLVIDHTEHEVIKLARAWEADNPRIRSIVAVKPGKRHALVLGVRAATSDIVALTDSDTLWAEDFLSNLLMGFADPGVGGVGCRQNVYQPGTSVWRRVADWMLDVRFIHYLPAMARRGGVACISGRTAAYRRAVILPLLDELEFEIFLGRRCISGDDGRLTWLILREGWRAGYQSTARATTVFPNMFSGFVKQRVRWSRNSYRCYLRAIARGWLWRQPVITSVSVIQNLLGPFTLTLATGLLIFAVLNDHWALAFITASWLILGRGIKGIGHLVREPETLVFLPLIAFVFIGVMIPIKFYALFTMNRQGWITRDADSPVAIGQRSDTLAPATGDHRIVSTVPADVPVRLTADDSA
jgi:cellulose synthase/poly-beta-1,6-N-acetylglucosamine synthase-like glycosyltransferase